MLLRILLTSLGGLTNLLPDNLPLVVLVLLDRREEGLALVFRELGVVHILIPVLLHTALGTRGERLQGKG